MKPGQVAFTVISENSTKEAHRLIAAASASRFPATNPCTGICLSIIPSVKPRKLPAIRRKLAAEMLATT